MEEKFLKLKDDVDFSELETEYGFTEYGKEFSYEALDVEKDSRRFKISRSYEPTPEILYKAVELYRDGVVELGVERVVNLTSLQKVYLKKYKEKCGIEWIARDRLCKGGMLYGYTYKPHKKEDDFKGDGAVIIFDDIIDFNDIIFENSPLKIDDLIEED